ncbi:MAG: hypothetical protein IT458_19910 [Planctomycetes bacterium]|nr:hypothetical protein [Planctomycetota bacterium]
MTPDGMRGQRPGVGAPTATNQRSSAEHTGWVRVTRARPCPVCAKPDWCTITADGALAMCMRVPDGAAGTTRNGGYLHRLRSPDLRAPRASRTVAAVHLPPDWTAKVAVAQAATSADDLAGFAGELGVAPESLRALGAFRSRRWPEALAVPMRDASGRVVGVRLRARDGRKWSALGGTEGLFLPAELAGSGPLLVPEGPTTTAACLTLAHEAIGRPSARPGAQAMAALLLACRGRDVVVVAERDRKPDGRWPGREGAEHTAYLLHRVARTVHILYPPDPHKDLRDALRAGLTAKQLCELIAMAPEHSPVASTAEVAP